MFFGDAGLSRVQGLFGSRRPLELYFETETRFGCTIDTLDRERLYCVSVAYPGFGTSQNLLNYKDAFGNSSSFM